MEHFSVEQGTPDISYLKLTLDHELVKSRVSASYCKQVIKDCEKYLKDELSQKGEDVKNLTGAYKSKTWMLHMEKWFESHRDVMLQTIAKCFKAKIAADDHFNISLIDSWYAKYTDDSIVAPHIHSSTLCRYAFCWYLDSEPDGTILHFTERDKNFPFRFFPGDLVIFPGSLMHWSNDTSKNRKIISGNFILTVEPLQVIESRKNLNE